MVIPVNNQRVQLQPAYLIHHRSYRDTSIIAEIFSAEHGRCSLVARGAKRPASKIRAMLQLFQPLLVSWVSKGEMGTLTGAEFHGKPLAIPARLLPSAFYLNELLLKLLHRHDPHIELFSSYDATLRAMSGMASSSTADYRLQACLRLFELNLLDTLGYGLQIDIDAQTGREITEQAQYEYFLGYGVRQSTPESSENGIHVSGSTLKMLNSPALLMSLAEQIYLHETGKHEAGLAMNLAYVSGVNSETVIKENSAAGYATETTVNVAVGNSAIDSKPGFGTGIEKDHGTSEPGYQSNKKQDGKDDVVAVRVAVDIEDGARIFREAKRLLRTVLDFYLGHRPVRSREMYSQISAKPNPALTGESS